MFVLEGLHRARTHSPNVSLSLSLTLSSVFRPSRDHLYLWEGRSSHHLHLGPQRASQHPRRPAGRGLQLSAEGRHLGAGGEHPRARRLSSAAHSKKNPHVLPTCSQEQERDRCTSRNHLTSQHIKAGTGKRAGQIHQKGRQDTENQEYSCTQQVGHLSHPESDVKCQVKLSELVKTRRNDGGRPE